jgi:hypothetical protein
MARKNLLAASVVAALGIMSMVGNARADALAQATLNVTNFKFMTGGVPLDVGAFAVLDISDGTTLNAGLNGASAVPLTATSVGGVGFPVNTLCAPGGTCPSPFVAQPYPATGNSSTAGSFLNGVPITGLPFAFGANATTAAFSQIVGTGNGNAQSGLTLNTNIMFKLNQAAFISLAFDASQILTGWADYPISSHATAGNTLSFNLTDATGATIFSWAPNGTAGGIFGGTVTSTGAPCNLQATASFSFPPGGVNNKSCGGTYAADETTLLLAGQFYNLGISQQSTTHVDAKAPEPTSLALVGLALAGLGFAGLRRRKV